MTLPPDYIRKIKSFHDWKNADISDMGYKVWGKAFPETWEQHKSLKKASKTGSKRFNGGKCYG